MAHEPAPALLVTIWESLKNTDLDICQMRETDERVFVEVQESMEMLKHTARAKKSETGHIDSSYITHPPKQQSSMTREIFLVSDFFHRGK